MVDRGGFPHGYHRLCGWLPSRPRAAALSSTTVGFVRFGTPCYILLLVSFVTVPASSSVAPPPVIPRKYVVLTKVMSTNELIEHWLLFLLKFNFPRRKKISLCVGLICSRRALLLLLFVCLFVCLFSKGSPPYLGTRSHAPPTGKEQKISAQIEQSIFCISVMEGHVTDVCSN